MTQIEQRQDSRLIGDRADKILEIFHQQQNNGLQNKEVEQNRRNQQEIAVLQTLMTTEFEPDLLAALHLEYVVRCERSGPRPEAVAEYGDMFWHIYQDHQRSSTWRWYISATRTENSYQDSNLSREAESGALQTFLLLKFGERREQLRKQAKEAAQRETQQKLNEAQQRADQEREERLRAERIAETDREDARWREEIATLKQQKLASMWRWPADTQIVIYYLTYTTAISSDESGEPIIEKEGGWAAADQLDANGYIKLQAEKSYYWSSSTSAPREIKLDTTIHRPVWERHTFSSVEELPETLRQEISVSLGHVVRRRDSHLLDEKYRLTKVESYGYDDDGPYSESVGDVPLPWLQALVELQAANAGTQPGAE